MKPEKKGVLGPAVLAALTVGAAGCADRGPVATPKIPSAASGVQVNRVGVTRLQPMGEACGRLFDSAGNGNWKDAGRAYALIAAEAGKTKTEKLPAVAQAVSEMGKAVRTKDAYAARRQANRLYRQLLQGSDPYGAAVPSSLGMVSYYAREIQLGCEKGDRTAAAAGTRRLIACWKSVDASVSDTHKADKQRLGNAVNALNHALSAGNLQAVRRQSAAVLQKAAALEQDCVGQNE